MADENQLQRREMILCLINFEIFKMFFDTKQINNLSIMPLSSFPLIFTDTLSCAAI